jgi:hypothetical protein
MNSTGWRVTPLGWIALATIAGLTVYFLGKALRNLNMADCTYTPNTN